MSGTSTWLWTLSAALLFTAAGCGKGSLAPVLKTSETQVATQQAGAQGQKSGNSGEKAGGDAGGTATGGSKPLAAQVQDILERNCTSCHGQKSSGGLSNITNLDLLVGTTLIVPGSPEESLFYKRIMQNMPPPPSGLIPKNESDVIAEWIRAGAPTSDQALNAQRKPLSLRQDILKLIESDFNSLGTKERAEARYFTSWPIWNLNISDEVIKDLDQGLAKFVNSLSLGANLAIPKALNAERSVFRVYLSDIGWTKDAWNIATAGETFFSSNPALKNLRALMGEKIPVVRIDEFIALNAVAPRYYDLQGLSRTLDAFLTTDLGRKNLAGIYADVVSGDASMRRLGFNDSQIADFSRVIERHSASGKPTFWMSHEFGSQNPDQDPFQRPLGPGLLGAAAGLVPKAGSELEFRSDGNEIIFEKPNGMLGFYVARVSTNAAINGERMNDAPSGVRDSTNKSATISVGASCMSCHYDGVIEKQDDIGKVFKTDGLPPAANALFSKIFSTDSTELFRSDRSRYQKALADIGVDFRRRDPIHRVLSAFSRNATREEVAILLEISDAGFNDRVSKLPAKVQQAWTALLKPGGQVARKNVSDNLADALAANESLNSATGGTTGAAAAGDDGGDPGANDGDTLDPEARQQIEALRAQGVDPATIEAIEKRLRSGTP